MRTVLPVPSVRRTLSLAFLVLGGCSEDAEDRLRSLPERVAERFQAGEIEEGLAFLAADAKIHGMTRDQVQKRLLADPLQAWRHVSVTGVVPEPGQEDQDERDVTVTGVVGAAGSPTGAAGLVQVKARLRRKGDDWEVIRVRFSR